ncbi:DUF6034 family protein [Acutalibacter caecimuris]|uniref:DUF6034 family protein n=1 Tax=Acutalibacter caecimuris TaxID=3093657 RepID=UPI002AC8CF4E|nr:DUF6034 family protein [Acutalibacter sp. M00118]
MKQENMGKRLAALLCSLALLAMPACQEDPEGSIVVHKDMDKLISQATGTGSQAVAGGEVVAQAKETETYRATVENPELGVTVNIDAQVEVPEVEALSVYRVRQNRISQAFFDQVRQALIGDKTLYSGSALEQRTKKELEREIAILKEEMDSFAAQTRESEMLTQEEKEEEIARYNQEIQGMIDDLQAAYESAPVAIDVTQYPCDGQLHTVEELAAQSPGEEDYYQWLGSLCSEGDTYLDAATDGADGNYQTIRVQNNADYSNKLQYRCSPQNHIHFCSVVVGSDVDFSGDGFGNGMGSMQYAFDFPVTDLHAYWQEKGVPSPVLTGGLQISQDTEFAPIYPETTISQEQAQQVAEAFLEQVGLPGFAFKEGGLYTEILRRDEDGKIGYGHYYILRYCRQIDGVPLTQSSGMKYADGWNQSGEFNKQMWPGEEIEFRINDSGTVGFDYFAPVEIVETVVEDAALKTFDQVKSTFEQMLPVTLGGWEGQHTVHVERVRLSYSRISEKDSFDTGLIVPVWSFEGTDSQFDQEGVPAYTEDGVLLAINAIDGSVIDGTLGY